MSASNVLFILSGSIACYKACEAISQLVQQGYRVRTVATESALKFVGAATLEGLTRETVATDLFAAGRALDHISLARWAHVTIVCPATASLINRMAAGVGDDLAGTVLLAHDWKKSLLIAPAMNPTMWQHPATAESVAKLRRWGARFVDVGTGRTACGEMGEGRLAEPAQIVAAVAAAAAGPSRRLRVLVTSGGTVEPIDTVRVITNSSTGATGAVIAEHFVRVGHEVVLLRASNAPSVSGAVDETFRTFGELDAALERLLGNQSFDAVIHAAAVSDFSLERTELNGVVVAAGSKLPSESAPVLHLRRNPKLIDALRSRSRNPAVRIVGFKLTSNASAEMKKREVQRYFDAGVADCVVHNDLSRRTENGSFPATLWFPSGDSEACADRPEIAEKLESYLVRMAEVAVSPNGA